MKKVLFITIIFLLFFLLFSSYKSLLYYSFGGRQPKLENENSLLEYYGEIPMVILKDTFALNEFRKLNIFQPTALIFNKNFERINEHGDFSKKCNASIDSLLATLDSNKVYKKDTLLSFSTLTKLLSNVKTKSDIVIEKNKNFYIIVFWNKFSGKSNYKSHVEIWDEKVKVLTEKNLNIQYIKVNTDYQESWGISKNQVPKIKIK